MRRATLVLALLGLATAGSCGLFLDYDALQKGSSDASAGGSGTTGGTGAGGSSGSSVGGGGASSLALDKLAPALASAFCDNLATCYASAVELVIHDEDCKPFFSSIIGEQVVAPIEASIARGTLTYDAVQGAQCVQRIINDTAQSPPVCVDVNKAIEDCKSMLGKTAGKGQPCRQRYECGSGLLCHLEGSCPGACQSYAQVGAACAQDSDCDPNQDLVCANGTANPDAGAGGATGKACQKRVPVNGACQSRDQCDPGTFCLSGTCKRIQDAFTSSASFPCAGNTDVLCKPGLSCEYSGLPFLSAASCVAQKALAAPCKFALPDECPKGSYCTENLFNTAGQCVASPSENQKCAADFEQNVNLAAPCAAGLACVNGLCKPLKHLSEPCEANPQCYSGACASPASGGAAVCVLLGCP